MPVYLCLFGFPFGIAIQNLVATVSNLLFITSICIDWHKSGTKLIVKFYRWPLLASTGLVGWICLATYLNPQNPLTGYFHNPFGYIHWILGPCLCLISYKEGFEKAQWDRLAKILAIVGFVWGVCCFTQALWGWRVLGNQVIFEQHFRPRGFYSHPLTLAYAAFILWPLAINWLFRSISNKWAWLFAIGILACVWFTRSRTIQFVALAIFAWNGFFSLQGKLRKVVLSFGILFLSAIVVVPNACTQKFLDTFSQTGVDKHSDYPDDRLAFWHVHWNMVKERPIVGHGFTLDTAYRLPYYKEVGLGDFNKPYEAHNMFLQLLANGGLIGLSFFLLWLFWFFSYSFRQTNQFIKKVGWQTFAGFALVGLTQNAFQDSSVRIVLTLFCAGLLVAGFSHSAANSPDIKSEP